MEDLSNQQQAVELLQELGLKEYEARAFVTLIRLPRDGTARDVSEHSEVPRTRVYDAIRVLEKSGLVEVQHANPQRFRAVPIDEAAETLRSTYESRAERLAASLRRLEPVAASDSETISQEIWALSGERAIANRTSQLLDDADDEIVLVIGHESIVADDLVERIRLAQQRGVTVLLGTISGGLEETIQARLPEANVFVSGLEWLRGTPDADDTKIGRLLLVDRNTILVSSFTGRGGSLGAHEQAVYGGGFDNGIVVIARRLMATGLLPIDDPGASPADGS
ncbi:TrmB family transcriptional regulator [Halovivax cerinus]|uniref:TrmB family transcriptional regulator n=1 Tax=Halovivax cerinus TaxID=1487865 RepID=A0ABD5NU49_9EURY|nr:helix-turn-helix domain-containing protein [Halovivax cerinus]